MKLYIKLLVSIMIIIVLIASAPSNTAFMMDMSPINSADGVKFIVASYHDSSMAIMNDGTLWAWGNNVRGQLGDGTTTNRYLPVKVMDNVTFVASCYNTYAIKSDDSLWGWGSNQDGYLGDGTTIDRFSPVKIMDNVKEVSTNQSHTLVLKNDGTLWTWGNIRGSLGDGATTKSIVPIHVMDNVIGISAGGGYSLAIKDDNSLWGWGYNEQGELGDGSTTDRSIPIKIMDNVKYVCGGNVSSYAIKEDNSLWGWGGNLLGELGDGTYNSKNIPIKIMDDVQKVSISYVTTFAVKLDGSLWGWGFNAYGNVGNGSTVTINLPIMVMDHVKDVSAGSYHSLAIADDDSLWAWGYNLYGQLGDGSTIEKHSPEKVIDGISLPAVSGIETSTGAVLIPEFEPDHYNYTISLPESVSQVTLKPLKGNPLATILIDGLGLSSKTLTLPLSGTQRTKIQGILNDQPTTYNITLTRWPFCDIAPNYPATSALRFVNGPRTVPINRYFDVFGLNNFLEQAEHFFYNGALCYGLSLSSLGFHNNILQPSWFQSGASNANDILSINDKILATLDRLQISQYSTFFNDLYVREKDESLLDKCAKLRNSDSNPCLIVMNGVNGGHAVIAYNSTDITFQNSDIGLAVHLYDPNYPANNEQLDQYKEAHLIIDTTQSTWSYENYDGYSFACFDVYSFDDLKPLIQLESDRIEGNNAPYLKWFFEKEPNLSIAGYSYAIINSSGSYKISDNNGGIMDVSNGSITSNNISDYYILPSLLGTANDQPLIIAIKSKTIETLQNGQGSSGNSCALAGNGYIFTSSSSDGQIKIDGNLDTGIAAINTTLSSTLSSTASYINGDTERNISLDGQQMQAGNTTFDISTHQFKVVTQSGFDGQLQLHDKSVSTDTISINAHISSGQGLDFNLLLSNTNSQILAVYKDTDGDGIGNVALQPEVNGNSIDIINNNIAPQITGISTAKNNVLPVTPHSDDADIKTITLTRNGSIITGWSLGMPITLCGIYNLTATDVYGLSSSLHFSVVPHAPTIQANPSSYNSIKISWSSVSSAGGYEVYRATSINGTYTKILTTTAASTLTYLDTGLTTGTMYYYKVRSWAGSVDAKVFSDYSGIKSIKPVPATPASPKAASVSYNSIEITWSAVAGASGYSLYRAGTSNGTYSLIATVVSPSYVNTNLATGSNYYYRIAAYRVVGSAKIYGGNSTVVSAKPIPAAPASPKAVSASYNSIKITWSAVVGASGYSLYRAGTSNGTYSLIASVVSPSYVNGNLTTGSNYYYRIAAYRIVGSAKIYGGNSMVVSAKPIPAVPAPLKAASKSYNSIDITWGAVAGTTKYEVWRSSSSSAGSFSLLSATTGTAYINTGVQTGMAYYYKVRAYRLVGAVKVYGSYSTVVSAKAIPSAPASISAVKVSPRSIKITWSSVAGATKYEVWRASSSTGTYSLVTSTSSLYYTNSGLIAGKYYYYKVRAYRLVGTAKIYGDYSKTSTAVS